MILHDFDGGGERGGGQNKRRGGGRGSNIFLINSGGWNFNKSVNIFNE